MEGDSPPLWAQPSAAFLPHRHRRPPSPPILNPVLLILLIPILCLLLMFFLLPPFLSHTSQFLRAGSVKQSWDSFNVFLVICAILCGLFARRNDGGSATTDNRTNGEEQAVLNSNGGTSQSSASDQWFMRDRPSSMIRTPATGSGRLRRSSSSYPDLRHESLWETDERRFRFFDDIELNHYRAPPAPAPATLRHLPARRTSGDRDDFLVKEIPVDTFVVHPTSTARPPSPPRPRPKSPENQPQQANQVQRRTFQSVPSEEEKVERDQFQFKIQTTTTDQPPPPLVTEEAIANRTQERKLKRSDRKKSGSAKDIATAIATSLYNQRKRKRRTRTRNIYDNANESASPLFPQAEEQPTPPTQMSAPPPPPPPPPPSLFQNIFKKGGKTKRVHSFSVSVSTPPPPPPPPPRSLFNNLLRTGSKSKRFQSASTSPSGPPPPPPPPPSSIFNNIFKSNTKSKRFHSNSTPPPPPPPPPSSTFRNMFRTGSKNKRFDPISRYPPWSEQSFEEPRYSQPQSPRLHTPPPSDSPRRRSATAGRPPLPTKMNHYYDGNENINSGGQSPLIRIPSPPPLPPFKIPETNFVARGDFVRIRSTHSSRCSSPGLDDVDFLPSRSSDAADVGDAEIPIISTCPSPDVNLKADSFIARLRGEWRIELMNSERRRMGQQP